MMMTVMNKHIISKTKFPGTNFLLFSECVLGVFCYVCWDVPSPKAYAIDLLILSSPWHPHPGHVQHSHGSLPHLIIVTAK